MSGSIPPRKRDVSDEQIYTPSGQGAWSDRLERRLLHKVLVAINLPAEWPGWLVSVAALLPILGVAGFWWLLVRSKWALYLAIMLALFTLFDALVLVSLPRRRLSFGPVGPQLYTLEFPRLLVAVLAAPLALWLGPMLALLGVVIINLGASLALAWGAFVEPRRLDLSHLSLAGGSLPHNGPPVRLLHISDLHLERIGLREQQLMQMVQGLDPDLILLTGDYLNLSYVDDKVAHAETRRVLESLFPDGDDPGPPVYAVLGSPPVDRNSASLFDDLPIRLLRDEVVTVDLGHGRRVALLGLDCSHDPEIDAKRLATIAAKAPLDAYRVLLYHSPDLMPVAPQFDINLYLCGHTHGGQVRLPVYGALATSSKLGKQFEMGYYRLGDTHLYVSRGIGLEGLGAPRVRFLCPPEIALVSLNGVGDRD